MLSVRSATEVLDSLFSYAQSEGLITSTQFRRGRIGILFSVIASEIVNWEQTLQNFQQEAYLRTALLDDDVVEVAAPLHFRRPATPSYSTVQFSWDIEQEQRLTDVTIPVGQIVETANGNPIQYITLEEATLYTDEEYTTAKVVSRTVGDDTMVDAGELINLEPKIFTIKVTNPQASWGGMDQESIDDVRANALSARYSMARGTYDAMTYTLLTTGLKSYQYNLVDNCFGYGSFGVYVDTNIDEFLAKIKDAIESEKAEGVYYVCEEATPVSLDFTFTIKISNRGDLLPKVRQNLIADITSAFTDYVTNNGVGQKIILSKAVHYLYQQLLGNYDIYDIHVSANNTSATLDSDGNIELANNEVAKINNIVVSTETSE